MKTPAERPPRQLVILGATGSIGRQAIEVVAVLPGLSVVGLVAGSDGAGLLDCAGSCGAAAALALADGTAAAATAAATDRPVLAGDEGIAELIASAAAAARAAAAELVVLERHRRRRRPAREHGRAQGGSDAGSGQQGEHGGRRRACHRRRASGGQRDHPGRQRAQRALPVPRGGSPWSGEDGRRRPRTPLASTPAAVAQRPLGGPATTPCRTPRRSC